MTFDFPNVKIEINDDFTPKSQLPTSVEMFCKKACVIEIGWKVLSLHRPNRIDILREEASDNTLNKSVHLIVIRKSLSYIESIQDLLRFCYDYYTYKTDSSEKPIIEFYNRGNHLEIHLMP
jgi:hypothetical protein